jgi:hypothetical protein
MSNQVYENQSTRYIDAELNNIDNQFPSNHSIISFPLGITGPWGATTKSYNIFYSVTSISVTLYLPTFLLDSDNNSTSLNGLNPLPSELLIPSGNFFLIPINVINQGNTLNGLMNINMSDGTVKFFISPTSTGFTAASNVGIVGTEINYFLQ